MSMSGIDCGIALPEIRRVVVDTAVNLTASHATTLVDCTTKCLNCFPSTCTDQLCSGATHLRKSEENWTLNEQLWCREPDSESQQAQRAYGRVLVDETIQ